MLGDDPDRLGVDEHRLFSGADLWRFDTLFEVRLKGGEAYVRREFDPVTSVSMPRGDFDTSLGGSTVGEAGER